MAIDTQKNASVFSGNDTLVSTDIVRVEWNEDKTQLMCPRGAFGEERFISDEVAIEIGNIVRNLIMNGAEIGLKKVFRPGLPESTRFIGQRQLVEAVIEDAGFTALELLAFLVFRYGIEMREIGAGIKPSIERRRVAAVSAVLNNRYQAAVAQERGCEIIYV